MAYLHMNSWDFWDHTPIEIDYALKAYYDRVLNQTKADWERTRTHIYYEYLFIPSKKRKVTYETFKKDYLQLGFDEPSVAKDVIDDEQFDIIQKIMKEKTTKAPE